MYQRQLHFKMKTRTKKITPGTFFKIKTLFQVMSSSSWRKQLKPRKMFKMQQSIIFRKTEEHHKICMREMFLEYYLPTSSGDVNKEWTTNISEKTMNKFRVHLSWVMGLSVFEWSPQQIGNQIIETFKKSGVFKSLTEVIIQKSSSVDYDYILC